MEKSRLSEEKIVQILSQASKDERLVVEICRENGISQNTLLPLGNILLSQELGAGIKQTYQYPHCAIYLHSGSQFDYE